MGSSATNFDSDLDNRDPVANPTVVFLFTLPRQDVERQWTSHELNHDSLLSWDEYMNVTYGFLSAEDLAGGDSANGFDYKEMIKRDKTRFTAADGDKDDKLTQVGARRITK